MRNSELGGEWNGGINSWQKRERLSVGINATSPRLQAQNVTRHGRICSYRKPGSAAGHQFMPPTDLATELLFPLASKPEAQLQNKWKRKHKPWVSFMLTLILSQHQTEPFANTATARGLQNPHPPRRAPRKQVMESPPHPERLRLLFELTRSGVLAGRKPG